MSIVFVVIVTIISLILHPFSRLIHFNMYFTKVFTIILLLF